MSPIEIVYKCFDSLNDTLPDEMILLKKPDQKIMHYLDSIGIVTLISELNDVLVEFNIEDAKLEDLTSSSLSLNSAQHLANFLDNNIIKK